MYATASALSLEDFKYLEAHDTIWGACSKMGNRKSACLYIDRGVLEAARRAGFNLSTVSEMMGLIFLTN